MSNRTDLYTSSRFKMRSLLNSKSAYLRLNAVNMRFLSLDRYDQLIPVWIQEHKAKSRKFPTGATLYQKPTLCSFIFSYLDAEMTIWTLKKRSELNETNLLLSADLRSTAGETPQAANLTLIQIRNITKVLTLQGSSHHTFESLSMLTTGEQGY